MSNLPTEQSAVLLGSILRTLEQINEKLSIQERPGNRPGEGQGRREDRPSRFGETRTAWAPLSPLNTVDSHNRLDCGESVVTQTLRQAPSCEVANHDLGAPRVAALEAEEDENIIPDYRSWRSPLKDSPLHQHSFLTEELGDAWTMPDDGRLPLSFSREALEGLNPDQLRATVSHVSEFRDRMARSSDLCFYVIDYDAFRRHIVYRLGEPTVVGMQQWKPLPKINTTDAPWRRFVLCQALNTVQEIDHDSASWTGWSDKAPFLLEYDRCNTGNYFMTAIDRHIECLPREQTIYNQYETCWEAFHITFYEASNVSIPEVTKDLPRGQWRHGPLYGSHEWNFCESALTLIAIPGAANRPRQPPVYEPGSQYERFVIRDHACQDWSILLLAPLGFFHSSALRLPLQKYGFMARIGEKSMEGAIVYLLQATYHDLLYNWSLFKRHFQGLLDQGDEEIALFRPALHDELLQDDEMFSRSRRYAWAIKCLTNFERSVSDNILQWKNYKSARLDHLLKPGILSDSSRKSIDKIEHYCTQLEALRKYFAMKSASTRALRDGLFSASTVVESRTSTRLAKNIRLLTFVSIFFQPLAFCTSLWSINNTFSSTALIYTSIAVGLSTYLIVFHLNSLVYQTTSAYTPMRETLIARMRNDSRQHWASKGKQFATFQPKHETLQPSEWWILLFVFQGLFTSLPRLLSRKNDPDKADTEASPATIVLPGADGAAPESAGTDRPHAVEGASAAATASCTSDDCSQPPAREVPA